MTAQAPELAAVVARLEKVERQNRRLKGAGIVILVLAAAGLLMGQAMPKARIVEAEGFVLKDRAGKVRAKLNVFNNGPMLGLYDENGRTRALLAAFKEGSMLTLYDENGKLRAGLGRIELETIKTGTAEQRPESSLVLFDKDGKVLWSAP